MKTMLAFGLKDVLLVSKVVETERTRGYLIAPTMKDNAQYQWIQYGTTPQTYYRSQTLVPATVLYAAHLQAPTAHQPPQSPLARVTIPTVTEINGTTARGP
ncbi:MAG: hypothetical protein MK077_10905 [Phycisphaerales bacterium]|nr:hypothetical protein [Phycisphaerales bacterium]